MFEKLEKSTYSELIAARIKGLILERKLGSGDRLPSEREMANQFGVSRSSIREAIKALSALGLVEVCSGDGTYVSANLTKSVLQPLSWAILLSEGLTRDLVEARKIIEPSIAALAAKRAGKGHEEQMFETIQTMERMLGDPAEVAKADLKFHLVLARAAGNQVLLETMVGLQHLLRPLMTKYLLEVKDQQLALCDHIEIYEAIKMGDADRAREAMARSVDKDGELVQENINPDEGSERRL